MQNTPPGSAAPSLLARAELEGDDLEAALEVRRDLVQVWSLRETPHVFPGADLVVFIHGLLPWDEEGLRYFVRPSRTWTRRGWPPRSC